MRLLIRYRVGLVLPGLVVLVARAVARRDLDVKLRIHADRGDFVKAGQLLVAVDDLEPQASRQQAHATLLTGEAGLEMARSTLEGQRANLGNTRA